MFSSNNNQNLFDASLRQFSFFLQALISCDALPVIRIRHAAKIHRALPVQAGVHKHTDTPLFALKETKINVALER